MLKTIRYQHNDSLYFIGQCGDILKCNGQLHEQFRRIYSGFCNQKLSKSARLVFDELFKKQRNRPSLKTTRSQRQQAGRRMPALGRTYTYAHTHAQTDGQTENIIPPVPSAGCADV